MGLIRNAALASTFGAGPELDAYLAAFRLPDAIFQLVVGAALASAFIPTFTATFTKASPEAAWRLASAVLTWFTLAGALCTAIAFVAAPWIMPLLVPGFSAGDQSLTIALTRVMLASSIFFCASVVLTGILNARFSFLLPALSPLLYNLSIIAGVLWLVEPMGVFGPAWGVTIGALLHLLVQVPALPTVGMRFFLRASPLTSGVAEVLKLMAPRVLTLASVQINLVVTMLLASTLAPGAITALSYAWSVTMLPLGVLGMAPATAAFPTLAYAAAEGDWARLRGLLTTGLRLVLFVAIPTTVGLMVARYPLVTLLFERGNFDSTSTSLTAIALLFFSVGLLAHVTLEVVSRGFYALQNTRIPLLFALGGMLAHAALSLVLIAPMGLAGLALATSLSATLEAGGLSLALGQRLGGLEWGALIMSAAKTSVATLVMGSTVYALLSWLSNPLDTAGAAAHVVAAGALGGAIFVGVALILRSAELEIVWRQLFSLRWQRLGAD